MTSSEYQSARTTVRPGSFIGLIGLIFGLVLVYIDIDILFSLDEFTVLLLLAVAVIAPFIRPISRHKIDIFEPVYFSALLTFAYFVLSPMLLVYNEGGLHHVNGDYRPLLSAAMLVVLIGLLGFYFGYYTGKQYFRRPAVWLTEISPIVMRQCIYSGFIVTICLITLWIFVGGFPLWTMNIFAQGSHYVLWVEHSEINVGYLYNARFFFIPLLLLALAYRSTSKPSVLWFMLYAAVTIFYLVLAGRILLVVLFIATGLYLFLERGRRPKIWHLVLLGIFVVYLSGFMERARAPGGGAQAISLQEAGDSFKGERLMLGLAVVLDVFPTNVPFQGGRFLLEAILLPVPRVIWPEKPAYALKDVLDPFIPPISFAVPPLVGVWYADFALIGPFVIMALLGLGCAYVYRVWQTHPAVPAARVLLAVLVPSLISISLRSTMHIVSWGGYVLGSIVFIAYLAKLLSRGKRDNYSPYPF